ncbi:MAG: hypothetical protein M3463_12960, partial [Verrucomicrobiota bacterium]|nr:hypothetical protein [Verrucomicrobiota bacterium]
RYSPRTGRGRNAACQAVTTLGVEQNSSSILKETIEDRPGSFYEPYALHRLQCYTLRFGEPPEGTAELLDLFAQEFVENMYCRELARTLHRCGYTVENSARGDFRIAEISTGLLRAARRHPPGRLITRTRTRADFRINEAA